MTSTLHPNFSSRNCFTPTRRSKLGFMSTNTSTSLDSFCSFRATEPNKSMELTPNFWVSCSLHAFSCSMHLSLLIIANRFCTAKIRLLFDSSKYFVDKSLRGAYYVICVVTWCFFQCFKTPLYRRNADCLTGTGRLSDRDSLTVVNR